MSTPALSESCQAVLESQECYAKESGPNSFAIHRSEGEYVCSVTAGIAAADLQSIFFHAARVYQRAFSEGRRSVQAELRYLINAAPLEPLS